MMLLYEYRVRREFERLKAYAQAVREKFEASATADDLLRDTENLAALHQALIESLPAEVAQRSSVPRRLYWMRKRLGEGTPAACAGDITDICDSDIPSLEKGFTDWHASGIHLDPELRESIETLIEHRQFDSAVRRGFVLLTNRIRSKFSVPVGLSEQDLVNHVFGNKGELARALDPAHEKTPEGREYFATIQSLRDLLAGLYGVFRRHLAHTALDVSFSEAEATLSMINFVLKWLDDYRAHLRSDLLTST